jgi:hypothetical protein
LDFVQYTAAAYRLLLVLVDVILGAFLGPFRFASLVILALLLGGVGLMLWLRRPSRR